MALQTTHLAVRAENLTKAYGSKEAVHGLDFQVRRGALYGFLGSNGAGKTTTIKMLSGLLRPSSGTAEVAGVNAVEDPLEVKRRIGFVPDNPQLFEKLTAREYLMFVGDVYGMQEKNIETRSKELFDMFDLSRAADELLEGYSHGMQQKCAVAAALLHEPEVLFLDEPTVGLDPASARLMKDILRSIAQCGGTVFLTTHVLEIAEALCDEIGIIQNGHILASGALAGLRAQAQASEDNTLEDVFLELTGTRKAREMAGFLQEAKES